MARYKPKPVTAKSPGIDRAVQVMRDRYPNKKPHAALAFFVGCSQAAVYQWQMQGGIPQTHYAAAVAEVTGIPVADLVIPSRRATSDVA